MILVVETGERRECDGSEQRQQPWAEASLEEKPESAFAWRQHKGARIEIRKE